MYYFIRHDDIGIVIEHNNVFLVGGAHMTARLMRMQGSRVWGSVSQPHQLQPHDHHQQAPNHQGFVSKTLSFNLNLFVQLYVLLRM